MLTLKRLTLIVLVVDAFLMGYTFFLYIAKVPKNEFPIENYSNHYQNRSDGSVEKDLALSKLQNSGDSLTNVSLKRKYYIPSLEIWSKAAIGFYLWEHILKGAFTKRTQFYQFGIKKFPHLNVKFKSGPSLTPQSLESFLSKSLDEFGKNHYQPTNVVLVLNGRSQEKIDFAKLYLDRLKKLHESEYSDTFSSGAVLLGHEFCFNRWIEPYLASNGGPLKFLFVVYDWAKVDHQEVFQWPLGVATYRNFPNFDANRLNLESNRPYSCNFLGTVYPNSSRQELVKIFGKENKFNCFIKFRREWEPKETRESSELYLHVLRLSDLTLSPIGMNHESYRIYEALTFGSIPVLEENPSHIKGRKSHCDQRSVYRLLKHYKAPFTFISNWTLQLTEFLKKENGLSSEFKAERRIKTLNWYNDFKSKLRDHFLHVVMEKFRL